MTFMALKRILMAAVMIPYFLFNYVFNDYAYPAVSTSGAYVFCYFVGNEVDEQRIHLAVSTDGYNFEALNNNEPVILQTKGTGCVRDPYMLKGVDENGKDCYFIIATDMNALEGWTSNHALITWKSYDMINWTDELLLISVSLQVLKQQTEHGRLRLYGIMTRVCIWSTGQIQLPKTILQVITMHIQRISRPLKPSRRCFTADGMRLTPKREKQEISSV